jgi:hypothetical protein
MQQTVITHHLLARRGNSNDAAHFFAEAYAHACDRQYVSPRSKFTIIGQGFRDLGGRRVLTEAEVGSLQARGVPVVPSKPRAAVRFLGLAKA